MGTVANEPGIGKALCPIVTYSTTAEAIRLNRELRASRRAGFAAWKRGIIADAIATWDAEDTARGYCIIAPYLKRDRAAVLADCAGVA